MFKRLHHYFLCSILLLSFSPNAHTQVNQQDSLALVDFYHSTRGHLWTNNNNWLQGPVANWAGIGLTNDQIFVRAIDLPFNNLSGSLPPTLCNLQQLQLIGIEFNQIQAIPDFTCLPNLDVLICQGNRLLPEHINVNLPAVQQQFQYSPQFAAEDEHDFVCIGEDYLIPSGLNPPPDMINWQMGDATPINPNFMVQADGSLVIQNMGKADQNSYYFDAFYNSLDLNIIRHPFEITYCERDALNGPVYSNQLVVKFIPNLSEPQKESLRNDFNASKIADVLCSDIELWDIPDTLILVDLPLPPDTLIGVEEINEKNRQRTEIEESEPNNILRRLTAPFGLSPLLTFPEQAPSFPSSDSLVVAIIDTGIDDLHPNLSSYIKLNSAETPDGIDNDGNCLIDDIAGLNMIDSTQAPSDDNSHGSHVSGIITAGLQAGSGTKILTVKSHDDKGRSSLFNLILGVYYACSQEASVINISSGYYGEESLILKEAIKEAAACNAIVVTSAGNLGEDTDLPYSAHYPSGYQLPNLVSVAALTDGQDGLAEYSNFGATTIDLAAPGTAIVSAVLEGRMDDKSGSSMSAAWLSGAAINLMEEFPAVQHQEIRSCLLATVTPVPGLVGKTATGGKLDYLSARTCISSLPPGLRLNYFLDGPFDTVTNKMKTDLIESGFLPTVAPPLIYGVTPDNAGIPINPELLTLNGDSAIVDWILLQLRDGNNPSLVLENIALLIRSNGQVITTSGEDAITFPQRAAGDYHLSLIHRNHLALISLSHVTLSNSYRKLNFTSTFNSSGQNNILLDFGNGNFGPAAGDASQDGIIDSGDRSMTWNFRNQTGYLNADVTGDGQVDSEDRSKTWNNRNKVSQLP